jgi:hypothetical protein
MRATSVLAIAVVSLATMPAGAEPVAEPVYYVPMTPAPPPPPPPLPYSKTPFYIAAAITGGLAITTAVVWRHGSGNGQDVGAEGLMLSSTPPELTPEGREHLAAIRRWYWEMGALAGVTMLGGVVTTVLWAKSETPAVARHIQLAPVSRGAALSFDGQF